MCRWRPECIADLLAGGGGGAAVRRWRERWGLPAFCWNWGRAFCREKAKTPWLPAPVAAFVLPTATTTGWDWLAAEQRHEAEARLAREMPRAAAREAIREAAAALQAAAWLPFTGAAVAWDVRRRVPPTPGAEVESLQQLADEFGLAESVISEETARVAAALGLPAGGRRPGRRPEPQRRAWRAILSRYRPR